MIYRVKQFLWAIVSHFKEVDYKYVDKFLDSKEKELFNKLKHNEKHHSIRVCKDAINRGIQVNIDDAIDIEAYDFGKCFSTKDQKEGMTAFIERREKNFQNK